MAFLFFAFNNAAAAPEALSWKSLVIPNALVVVGPWGDEFRWREALHAQGIGYDDAYRAHNIYHRPFVQMHRMPASAAEYRRYSVIVLADVDAPALGEERLAVLRDFVNDGGGLVVLGGYWAFQRGGYAGTPLAEMLPVRWTEKDELRAHGSGELLAAAPQATWKLDAKFTDAPRAFYLHDFAAKENATVQLSAGPQPAVVTGNFGRGRVVACGLTIHGKAAPGTTAFWNSPGWLRVLGHAIEWAGENRPLQPSETGGTALKPLTDDELLQLRLEGKAVSAELLTRFAAAPSAPAANALFQRFFSEGDTGKAGALAPEVLSALARFAKPEWAEALLKPADRLNPDTAQRSAALELLGATRSPKAAALLAEALPQPDVAIAATDGLQRLGDAAHVAELLRVQERSAAAASFVEDREPEPETPASTRARHLTAHSAVALYRLGEHAGVERVARLFALVRLQQRIHANAAKRRVADTDPTGQTIRKIISDKAQDLARLEEYLLKSAGPVPESQRAAFIAFAQTAEDEAEVRWLAAALAHSPGGAHWVALATAKDGIIRRAARAVAKP